MEEVMRGSRKQHTLSVFALYVLERSSSWL